MTFTTGLLQSCLALLLLYSAVSTMRSGQDDRSQTATRPTREFAVVEKWRGTWDVKATRRYPKPVQTVTYVETYDWVLDRRYLRSETTRKWDGGQTMSMFWFDVLTKTYRVMVFDSSGLAVELPPPTWDESTQTMQSKGGPLTPTSYTGYATFEGPDTIRWKALWKDWKGTVFLDLEGTSIRRK
jgi:hypothetical protein